MASCTVATWLALNIRKLRLRKGSAVDNTTAQRHSLTEGFIGFEFLRAKIPRSTASAAQLSNSDPTPAASALAKARVAMAVSWMPVPVRSAMMI